jgi:2'-5' RNA ligase
VRAFIAIELDEALRSHVAALIDRLRKLAPDARWVRPDRLHVTLSFLGEIADAAIPEITQALGRLAQRHAPLSLSAGGGGTFGPPERPKVLWVALGGDLRALGLLQGELTRELGALGHPPEHERFEPHLTLARSAAPRGDAKLEKCSDALRGAKLGLLQVTEVVLFASSPQRDGMNHVALSRHALRT